MYNIKKIFKVETAHILDGSYMKECQRLHGHSAKIVISLCSLGLNNDGMVMDFKLLKELFKPLYDTLDHRCLISEERAKTLDIGFPGILVVPFNPTAENIAAWLYNSFEEILNVYRAKHPGVLGNFYVDYIEYWETENACVRYDKSY